MPRSWLRASWFRFKTDALIHALSIIPVPRVAYPKSGKRGTEIAAEDLFRARFFTPASKTPGHPLEVKIVHADGFDGSDHTFFPQKRFNRRAKVLEL